MTKRYDIHDDEYEILQKVIEDWANCTEMGEVPGIRTDIFAINAVSVIRSACITDEES